MTADPPAPARDAAAALAALLGPRARLDEPFGARTTYRVGGRAAVLVEVESEEDLELLREAMSKSGASAHLPVLVLGKGSNLLVADTGFFGVVVRPGGRLGALTLPGRGDEAGDRPLVRAGGALGLPVLARRTVDAGWRGLEWAVGIPGSVGGALKMNAGGHGADTASCLVRYRAFDLAGGGVRDLDAAGLGLGYRSSALGDAEIVVWAELAVHRGEAAAGKKLVSDIVRWRREHQPGGSNAGSVFTNPPDDSAGRLVEAAGLKGFRLGSARVSDKHANFIQADEGGRAADVVALMAHVRRTVATATGVILRPEVRLVGFGADPLEDRGGGLTGTVQA